MTDRPRGRSDFATRLDSLGGKTGLENADFQRLDGRYDICISGRTNNLTIDG